MLNTTVKDNAVEVHGNPVLERSLRLRKAMTRLGLTCLDREWRGVDAKYQFRCERHHVFTRAFQTISQPNSGGCRICLAENNDARLLAKVLDAGVSCLETGWLGSNAVHRFRCSLGHEWQRLGSNVLRSARCPNCEQRKHNERARRKNGLSKLQQAAASRGGICLAKTYGGGGQTYAFRCAEGHVWEAVGNDVIRRTWCPTCARLRKVVEYRLEDGLVRLKRKAAERGGSCLSEVYEGSSATYRMRCAQGHEWATLGKRLLRGGWCVLCAHDAKRLSLDDAKRSAEERGGQCLSTAYVKAAFKLHWLCHRGHSWHAAYASIRAGSWCPECAHIAKITNRKSKARLRYGKAPMPALDDAVRASRTLLC